MCLHVIGRFGNAHNVVANEDTGYVYVVGATDSGSGYNLCSGDSNRQTFAITKLKIPMVLI